MRRRRGTIQGSVSPLYRLEQQDRHPPQERRLNALRLLREEPSRTMPPVANLLGSSTRPLPRWWKASQPEGREGGLRGSKGGGKRPVRIGEEGLRRRGQGRPPEGFTDDREQPVLDLAGWDESLAAGLLKAAAPGGGWGGCLGGGWGGFPSRLRMPEGISPVFLPLTAGRCGVEPHRARVESAGQEARPPPLGSLGGEARGGAGSRKGV